MQVNRIITYKNAWEIVKTHYQIEINEVKEAMGSVYEGYKQNSYGDTTVFLYQLLISKDWKILANSEGVGIIKNNISIALSRSSKNLKNYLFQQTFNAFEKGIIKMPILVTFCENVDSATQTKFTSIEEYENMLTDIAPLSHKYPFLILGYSDNPSDLHIIEISETSSELHKIMDKYIEFPSEYHQAGLGILNYFATYLREQYPDEDARVKIEQDGLIIRLIVETKEGKSEIIEKALHEYQLIIRGEEKPETFTNNTNLIIGLKNKLEIAKLEIRMQQNLIGMQNDRIDDLLNIVSQGLASRNVIDFRPHITINNEVTTNIVGEVQSDIQKLLKLVDKTSETYNELSELSQHLEALKAEKNPEVLKNSKTISKFREFIESIAEGKTLGQKTIKAVEGGWDIFKSLGTKYNSIAELCGLPQIPSLLLK